MSRYISLLPFVVLVMAAAVTGSKFMPGEWYAALVKPSWTPPNWAFPIAWTILYAMIAIAGWFAWRAEGIGLAVVVWAAGLVLNALWSYLMFGRHDIAGALIDLILMWISIVVFIALTWKSEPRAAYLFMPYLLWVSYAGALNLAIWRLN
jgi:translocator protein